MRTFLLWLILGTFFSACQKEQHKPLFQNWEIKATFQEELLEHRSIVLDGGQILITGGTGRRRNVYLYDPVSERLESRTPMQLGRESHELVPLPGGKVLAIGGFSENLAEHTTTACEMYDPATDAWTSAAPMTTPRAAFTATVMADGSIVVTGGFSGEFYSTATAERYWPEQNRWESMSDMQLARHGHQAIRLKDGRLFVISGHHRDFYGEIYSPTTDQWRPTHSPGFNFGPLGTRAVAIAEGQILVTLIDSIQVYDLATDRWQTERPMLEMRNGPEFVELPDRRFLAVGGQGSVDLLSSFYQPPVEILNCEIFNPRTRTWQTGPALNQPKYLHTVHRVDDQVIVIGGQEIEALKIR